MVIVSGRRNRMETYFEGDYTFSEANVKEMYGYYAFGTPLNKGLLILVALLLPLQIYTLCAWGVSADRISTLLMLLFTPAVIGYKYVLGVRRALARNRESYGDQQVSVHMGVTGESVHFQSCTGTEGQLEFASFKEMVITKNLIILRTKAKQYVVFEKARFTKGTWEALVKYMKDKGLKMKKWP